MSTLNNHKVIDMSVPKTLSSILENMSYTKPVQLSRTNFITEADSNEMIDKLASAIKFKDINGDADNSYKEGSYNEEVHLDSDGNYVGKGKMTIFNKDVDLKNPTKTTEQWMETPSGRVSDAKTEEVPNMQGYKNINESIDVSPIGEEPSQEEMAAHGMGHMKPSELKAPNIEEHRNMKSIYNQPKTSSIIKDLFNKVPTKINK